MIERIGSLDDDPEVLVERCLDSLGGIKVRDETYTSLVNYAVELQNLSEESGIHNLIQMTASTVDYQFS